MDRFVLSQIIIAVAGVLYFSSFQFKARERVLLCIVAAAYCIAAHFFLLGRSTAGLLACVSGTRVLTGCFNKVLLSEGEQDLYQKLKDGSPEVLLGRPVHRC